MAAKRPLSSDTPTDLATKRRRITHSLHYHQRLPAHIEPAPQDAAIIQAQFLRSISAALVSVGFESARPEALEMFRSHAEEYMLQFATYIRHAMNHERRTSPVATDFSAALALMPNTRTASLLKPQLKLGMPKGISYPSIPPPPPALQDPPDLSGLLADLTNVKRPPFVPSHFPGLPPAHAWKATPVYPSRETDARKMREKATAEGLLAEQALRKLASAAKAGALRAEEDKRKRGIETGHGKKRGRMEESGEVFGDVLKELGGDGEDEGIGMEMEIDAGREVAGQTMDLGMPEGVVVNYGMGGWRHGRGGRGVRA